MVHHLAQLHLKRTSVSLPGSTSTPFHRPRQLVTHQLLAYSSPQSLLETRDICKTLATALQFLNHSGYGVCWVATPSSRLAQYDQIHNQMYPLTSNLLSIL